MTADLRSRVQALIEEMRSTVYVKAETGAFGYVVTEGRVQAWANVLADLLRAEAAPQLLPGEVLSDEPCWTFTEHVGR